jgi:hypothetical protein
MDVNAMWVQIYIYAGVCSLLRLSGSQGEELVLSVVHYKWNPPFPLSCQYCS